MAKVSPEEIAKAHRQIIEGNSKQKDSEIVAKHKEAVHDLHLIRRGEKTNRGEKLPRNRA
jgi:hypothetical protein